jgi:hypothetical protein
MAETSRRQIHQPGADQVGGPSDQEDEDRSGDTPMGKKGTQADGGIGGDRRHDILHRGEEGENAIDGRGR